MANKFIEKIKIAELDPSKTYFMQICCNNMLNNEQLSYIHKILKEEFDKNNIKNILFFTPLDMECKFIEVANGE